jgi:Beta propeller domain
MTKTQRMRALCALGLLLAAAGCAKHADDDGSNGGSFDRSEPVEIPGTTKAAVAMLMQADDCGDLLEHIKDDVVAKIDAQAASLRKGPQDNGGYYPGGGVVGGPAIDEGFANGGSADGEVGGAPPQAGGAGTGGSFPSDPGVPTDIGGTGGTAAPGTGTSGGSAGMGATDGKGTSSPTGHSETNTQVEGVDEADIVKLADDGNNMYLLHGNTIFKLAAWPAESTAILGQAPIEGSATELFVNDGKAVVFSTLWNQGDLVPLKTDSSGRSVSADYYQPYYYGAPFTKITVLDVSGDTPEVVRELFVEGSYLSSRRHGNVVRAIVQGGFHTPPVFNAYIEYTDPWGEPYAQEDIDAQVDVWRDRLVSAIEETTIDDWVPVERERKDGKLVVAAPRCKSFYAPPPALTNYGLTNVVSFDMSEPSSELGGAIILGSADTVYANDSSLVLAQRDYRYLSGFMEREQTIVHMFKLDEDRTTYGASGFVPGHILNQFSMDVAGDTLRIATTQNIWQNFEPVLLLQGNVDDVPMAATRTQTDNRVITLRADGTDLDRVGITEPLGKDGERIMSARFVGDRGYVTTFQQIDPLVVLDLADPEHPEVLGQLEIPGFSEYMHPLDAGHLLTIGRNTDLNGRDTGLLLQIFDVTDPLDPQQTHTVPFEPSGWSEASGNHKAFTYWVPEGETDGLLAFPYSYYGSGYGFESTLQVFRVSATDGFTALGVVDHTGLFSNCYDMYGYPTGDYYAYTYCQQPEVRRGMFVQDDDATYVYSLSHGGVLVNALDMLDTPVATVTLPAPDYSEHRTGEIFMDDSTVDPMGNVGTGGAGGTAGVGGGIDPGVGVAGTGAMTEPAQPEVDAGAPQP